MEILLQVMYEEASQVATDAVSGIRTVASFCAEKRVMETYNHKCEASMNQAVRTGWVAGLGFGFSHLMLYLGYAFCFYVGAKFTKQGKVTFVEIFKVTPYGLSFCKYSSFYIGIFWLNIFFKTQLVFFTSFLSHFKWNHDIGLLLSVPLSTQSVLPVPTCI
jgi:ABC-type multidrug transport system fused ATPase/permease subunit